ncbi:hypothetical protein CR513_21545, partial [Mucuna pruriens]
MNTMLVSSSTRNNLQGKGILSASTLQNRIPHKRIRKTPYDLWKGCQPNLKYLKVWGCLAKGDSILLSQGHYVKKLLKKCGFCDLKLVIFVRLMRYLRNIMDYNIEYNGFLGIRMLVRFFIWMRENALVVMCLHLVVV